MIHHPLINIYTCMETLCFIIAVCCFRSGSASFIWRLQPLYLAVVVLVELMGTYMSRIADTPNLLLYNLFLILEGIVISTLIAQILRPYTGHKSKLWYRLWLLFFALFYLLEWQGRPLHNVYLQYSVVLMSVVFTAACIYYFYRLIRSTPYTNVLHHAPFWWMSGTFIFYFGGLGSNLFLENLMNSPIYIGTYLLNALISNALNIILYTLWSYSFIIRYRHPNSLQSSSPSLLSACWQQ